MAISLTLRQATVTLDQGVALGLRALAAAVSLPTGAGLRAILRRSVYYRFAPLVRLYPHEVFRPSSVDWYLPRVHMRLHRASWPDKQILDRGRVTDATIAAQKVDDQRSDGTKESNFFLQIPNDDEEERTRTGNLATAVVYVNVINRSDGGEDIQYWFFYPYSGNISPVGKFEHEGDFEHITVRVSRSGSVSKVYYAAHDGEGEWYGPGKTLTADGRPLVYSAKHSHASFPTAGVQKRGGVKPNDETADGGPEWNTWKRLEILKGDGAKPPNWIKYSGRWGEVGSADFLSTSGPRGPAFQGAWRGDPE